MATTRLMYSNFAKLLRAGKIYDNVGEGILSVTFNSHVAEVQYERTGDTYNLTHTSIPFEFQGYGLGSVLAEKVFDYLIARNKKIKLSCEFLENFYFRNKDKYKQFVV